jgi:hypothetical protein
LLSIRKDTVFRPTVQDDRRYKQTFLSFHFAAPPLHSTVVPKLGLLTRSFIAASVALWWTKASPHLLVRNMKDG